MLDVTTETARERVRVVIGKRNLYEEGGRERERIARRREAVDRRRVDDDRRRSVALDRRAAANTRVASGADVEKPVRALERGPRRDAGRAAQIAEASNVLVGDAGDDRDLDAGEGAGKLDADRARVTEPGTREGGPRRRDQPQRAKDAEEEREPTRSATRRQASEL